MRLIDWDASDAPELPDGYPEILQFHELGEPQPKEWIVDGLIGRGDSVVGFGDPGAGKSVLFEDLACHLATGKPWFGRHVERCGVLYLCLERREQVARRAQAFVKEHGIQVKDAEGYYTGIDIAFSSEAIDLRVPNSLLGVWHYAQDDMFGENAEQPGIQLIIVDTLSRAIGDGSDNDDRDMHAVAAELERFARLTGCAVLLIHHSPKSGDGLRGHTALLGAVDQTIHVKKRASGSVATVEKFNDSPDRPSLSYSLKSVTLLTDANGHETVAPVVVPLTEGEPDTSATGRKLAKGPAAVLDALDRCTAINGGAVADAAWREQFRDSDKDAKPQTIKMRFIRGRAVLQEKKLITETDGLWSRTPT